MLQAGKPSDGAEPISHHSLTLGNAQLERLHTGMLWAEGPAYLPALDTLVFSDIPNNRLLQYSPDLGVRIIKHDSTYTNGNTIDNYGRIVSCSHMQRAIIRTEGNGNTTILASKFDGKRLNSPNDVVVGSDGTIWFTDPTYGILTDYEGKRSAPEQASCNVYRIDPVTNDVTIATSSRLMPNGLALSLDEQTLYIADSSRSHDPNGYNHIFSYAIAPDNSLINEQVFYEVEHGVPDGIRLDEFGNVWSSSARGVEIISPQGAHLGHIAVPEAVSNIEFGGAKLNRLFITATTSLYSIYVGVCGAAKHGQA